MRKEVTFMKKILLGIAAIASISLLAGCDTGSSSTSKRLTFINNSTYRVEVIPLTTEWGGISLQPGDVVRLDKVRDLDWRYEPTTRVKEGSASTDRRVVFVNIE
jgi:hypothetical protein